MAEYTVCEMSYFSARFVVLLNTGVDEGLQVLLERVARQQRVVVLVTLLPLILTPPPPPNPPSLAVSRALPLSSSSSNSDTSLILLAPSILHPTPYSAVGAVAEGGLLPPPHVFPASEPMTEPEQLSKDKIRTDRPEGRMRERVRV